MPHFAVKGNKGTTSVRSIVNARCDATTLGRGKVYDYAVGNRSTPADAAFVHQLYRTSTAGTGSAVTPSPLDVADTASIFDASDTYTVDPTIGVVLYQFAMNQRASFRWVAQPGGELLWPATASNGITGGVASATTSDFDATLMVDSF